MEMGWVANYLQPLPPKLGLLRMPLTLGKESAQRRWFLQAVGAGHTVVLVLCRESFTAQEWTAGRYDARCRYWARLFPDAVLVEAGSEPDGKKGTASSPQTAARSQKLIVACTTAWGNAEIWGPGLVGIDFSRLDDLARLGCATACLHPYNQDADSLKELLAIARQHTPLPIVLSELGSDAYPDPHERAAWFTAMLIAAWEAGVQACIVYRYDDDGVDQFHVCGTESEAAVIDAAPNLAGDPPAEAPAPEPEPEPDWFAPVLARAQALYGGTPYAFGGSRTPGLDAGPWDCVGFVMECFDAAGIDLDPDHSEGNTNAERARQACDPVDQPAVGDLIFFAGTYPTPGASHIGIVIDPGAGIMADDHDRGNGTGPGETTYTTTYWQQHFLSFGRVRR